MCNGQILSIAQNTALFSLLGTTFGGDGRTNFALPNLQGSFPLNAGQGIGLSDRVLGGSGGEAAVTLLTTQIPGHTHGAISSAGGGTSDDPTRGIWAMPHEGKSPIPAYTDNSSANVTMNPAALSNAGGNQPHNNLPPYLVVSFIIAMQGIFPSRN
jgi:microcystin-dependent protein